MKEIVMGRINQLTHEPTGAMPTNKITMVVDVDTSAIDDAQQKADKPKATLLEVQELIRRTNSSVAVIEDKIISDITNALKTATTYHPTP